MEQLEVSEKIARKLVKIAKESIKRSLTGMPGYAFYRRGAGNALRNSGLCPLGTANTIVNRAVKEMIHGGEIEETETNVVYPKNHPYHPEVKFDGARLTK